MRIASPISNKQLGNDLFSVYHAARNVLHEQLYVYTDDSLGSVMIRTKVEDERAHKLACASRNGGGRSGLRRATWAIEATTNCPLLQQQLRPPLLQHLPHDRLEL